MSNYPPPSPAYVGPARWHGGTDNMPIHWIVMHGTVSPCAAGGAREIARYFANTSRPASTQYIVDLGEAVQDVYDSTVAYGAPPNVHMIHVELCDLVADKNDNPLPVSRWDDDAHKAELAVASHLVAQLCLAYDVPIRKVGSAGLLLGREGICGHKDVSDAWHQTTHWDPGAFPWRRFIGMVSAEAADLRGLAHQGPTRVSKFKDAADALLAQYLDPAIAAGRTGTVKDVRDNIRTELERLTR